MRIEILRTDKHKFLMYLNIKLDSRLDTSVSRKTILYVGIIHVAFIIILYLSMFIQNFFWSNAPQAIAVSLIGSASFQEMRAMEAAAVKLQAQKQEKKSEASKKKETKPTQKVPSKKTWKPLDISQITKPTSAQVKEFKPVKQTTATSTAQGVNASALAANLKKSLSSVKFGSAGVGSSQVNSAMLTYYDSISSFLYDRWDQPSKLAVSGEPPSVLVSLSIGADGRLMDYKIIKNSNFPEMNDSVKRMLDSVERLPSPPEGAMTIEATLILTN